MEVFWFIFIMIMIALACFMCKAGKRKPMFSGTPLGLLGLCFGVTCLYFTIRQIIKNKNRGAVLNRNPTPSAPVVVTTTTIPGPLPAGYPPQNTTIQGYPVPQPQPGYAPQPYPNQTMPSYPMPQPQPHLQQADFNPPSYDQVMRGGEAYQKQAPYNPNYTGQ